MTPQELKNSILQLAIQGKLVEQRPEEGTAEELYRQILEEKRRLVRAGKIKKEKPLPEITDDEVPFEIPESWKWIKLGNVASVLGGKRIPAGRKLSTENTGYRYIRVSDMKNGSVLIDGLQYVPQDIYPSISRYVIYKEDIYITVAGTIGKVGKIPAEIDGANLTENADRLVFTAIDQDWLIKCLETPFVQSQIADVTTKVGQPKLAIKRIQELIFPLPPLAEQKRIVTKIEKLLPYIDRYEQAWNRLEEFNKRFPIDMQKSLLQWAIQGKLVEQRPEEGTAEELYRQIQSEKQRLVKEGKIKKEKPLPEIAGDEVPFEIPEGWKWVRLLSVVDIATNLVQPSEYSEYMHIAPDNIEKATGHLLECHTVKEDKVASANHLFHEGQIIYSKIRPLLRKAVIAPFDGLCSADMYPLNTTLDSKYVLYYLLSDGYNAQIAEAMSSRVKMPKINQNELVKVLLPLPPLAEQKRIAARLEELLPLCERLK